MNAQTRTHIYDAVVHSNERSELRLDPMRLYSAELRLGQLKVANVLNRRFNAVSGVYSLIKNIYLMNNSDILDQLYEAHNYLAFNTSVQAENANNYSFMNHLNGNNNSYVVGSDHVQGDGVQEKKIMLLEPLETPETLSGYLNLKRCFNILSQLPGGMIDTNVFKNVSIVIEWRDRGEWKSCFEEDIEAAADTMQIVAPQLFADEILSPVDMPKSYKAQFLTFELDKFYCLGGVVNQQIQTKARCNAFTGKYIERILLSNIDPTSFTSAGKGDYVKCDGSRAYKDELINIVVDGDTVLDFLGCDTPARKLGILTDCFGDVCIPVGSNLSELTNADDLLHSTTQTMRGKLSFFGCFVRNRATEVYVHHQRTCTASERSPFWLYVLGQVGKELQVDGGGYNVAYL